MANKEYEHIDFVPPIKVAKEAEKGLMFREKFGKGGTIIGATRAHQLKDQKNLSPSTIKRMVSYFARHEVDKKAKDFANAENPSKGYIAWLLWGGDAGREWAEKIKDKMLEAEKNITE